MKKASKFRKAIKITLIVFAGLLLLLFITPFLFKGKIIKIANEQLAQNLNARASFTDASLSLFRNFPNLGVRIEGLTIIGVEAFDGDTLLYAETIDVAVNLFSAIKMDDIDVKRIDINKPTLHIIYSEDGQANWDIMVGDDEEEAEPEEETSLNIVLKRFSMTDAYIRYSDYGSDMFGSLRHFNISMKGDLSEENTMLEFTSDAKSFSFSMDQFPYLVNAALIYDGKLDVNLKDWVFTLKENKMKLNDVDLELKGSIIMPEDDITLDLSFGTINATFKKFLSLIPVIYKHSFSSLKADGDIKLAATMKGVITDSTNSDFDAKLKILDGSFSYPDLPKSARDINVDIDFHYDGSYYDSTTIDVNRLHLDLGGNTIDLGLSLRNPDTDPFFSGQLRADVNLKTLQDVIPLEDTKLSGKIKADVDWTGKYSFIEKEQYESFQADGSIIIKNLVYESPDVPKDLYVSSAELYFSPKQLSVADFDATLGSSDIRLNGSVTNYIPYILKDETIKGELNLKSNKLDLNELLTDEETEETGSTETESAPVEVIELPTNINFHFTSSIGNLMYDKMDLKDVEGDIFLKEGVLELKNLSMNGLDGKLAVSGEYDTRDITTPWMNLKVDATQIDIMQAVKTFEVLGKITPIANKANGKVTLGINLRSMLRQDMRPVLESIAASGKLASSKIGITGSDIYKKIGDELNTDALDDMTLNDINLDFSIVDGTLHVKPFNTKMGKANLKIGGSHTFSNTIDYDIDLSAPSSLLGVENPTVNSLYRKAAAQGMELTKPETVDILIKVSGDLLDPKIRLDLKQMAGKTLGGVVDEAKEKGVELVKEKTEEIKEDTKAKAREEADKILKEADQKAAEIRKNGKKAADQVRAEAKKNADKMVAAAKNPAEKKIKEAAAKKLLAEADEKAKKLESEADAQANKVQAEAQKLADEKLK
ncbi:MAG: hypothetical protein JW801_10020 [Bacteroidales bacterium]|nr:hypothetical protein [Bacteroidales bacterium]